MIFLACWLVLDLVWQNRLLRQVAHSHFTFAGLSNEEKLAAGPDARLYRSIAAVKAHINEPDARVMVATSDLYAGMRAAYFLYPLNAYWRLERPEIPDAQYLRKGDYILLLKPSRAYAHKDKGVRLPETRMYPAEMVYSSRTMHAIEAEINGERANPVGPCTADRSWRPVAECARACRHARKNPTYLGPWCTAGPCVGAAIPVAAERPGARAVIRLPRDTLSDTDPHRLRYIASQKSLSRAWRSRNCAHCAN